jgi:hypothetical protein
MKKAIFYTVCSYPEESKQVLDNVLPIVKGMAKWAEYKGVDFKCFTEIPDEVEDLFQQVQNKWNLPWDNKIKKHARKSWLTKFEAFHHFYKSDYDQMLFLDCDMHPRNPKINKLSFDYTNLFSCGIKPSNVKVREKIRPGRPVEYITSASCQPITITEKLLNRKISKRATAQTMYVTKDFRHNISDTFSYQNVLDACFLDWRCIREETFMTYILNKLDIIDEVQKMPFRLNCREILRPEKVHFVYENSWENIIV